MYLIWIFIVGNLFLTEKIADGIYYYPYNSAHKTNTRLEISSDSVYFKQLVFPSENMMQPIWVERKGIIKQVKEGWQLGLEEMGERKNPVMKKRWSRIDYGEEKDFKWINLEGKFYILLLENSGDYAADMERRIGFYKILKDNSPAK